MTNAATRLITLIMLLQRQPNQKAAELARKLGVSVRSLHRYMAMLDEMGIPVCSERGPYGGFSLVRGYKLPPLVLTPEEAVSVYLGASLVGEMWGQLYQAAAQGALAKLDNVLPDEQRREIAWARRALVTTGLHRASMASLTPLLEKLRRAIREQRRVSMVYQGRAQAKAQQRELDPYTLVHRWGWWYVFGHCHLRNAVRSFRLDRIIELALLDKTFSAPDDFDPKEYLQEEWASPTQVRVRMRFVADAAHVAQENHTLWDSFEKQSDGSIVVGLSLPDMMWAASMVLSFGPIALVLEPPELRQMVREWAGAIAQQYE